MIYKYLPRQRPWLQTNQRPITPTPYPTRSKSTTELRPKIHHIKALRSSRTLSDLKELSTNLQTPHSPHGPQSLTPHPGRGGFMFSDRIAVPAPLRSSWSATGRRTERMSTIFSASRPRGAQRRRRDGTGRGRGDLVGSVPSRITTLHP